MYTKQEAFDIVAAHLRAQGVKAKDDSGSCYYRGPNDTKCAIGALIPDEEYNTSLEGVTADNHRITRLPCLEGLSPDFLCELQDCHDSAGSIDCESSKGPDFEKPLGKLARRYGLEYKR